MWRLHYGAAGCLISGIGSDARAGVDYPGNGRHPEMTVIDLRTTYGDYVRKARREAGLSQAQVADALGTSQYRISRWENDQEQPRIGEHLKFVELTGLTVDLGELVISWNPDFAGQAA